MRYRYRSGDIVEEILLERQGDMYRATVYGELFEVELLDDQPGAFVMRATGPLSKGDLVRPQVVYWAADGATKWLSSGGCTYRLDRPIDSRTHRTGGSAAGDVVRAPMPAQVRAVQVAEGDAVEAGQTLLILEAMKMEIKLTAPRAGRVARITVKQGETVDRDQVILEMDEGRE